MKKKCMNVMLVGLMLFMAAWGSAQESRASLGGKVTDPNGAVIQNATVTVTAEATGVVQTRQTNDAGSWRVDGLIPGLYDFDITASGFEVAHYSRIDLQMGDQKLTMDAQLRIGAQTESVNVEATVPLIDTTAAVGGTVLTSNTLQELPTLSNSPTMFISLMPGVTVTPGMGHAGVYPWSQGGLSQMSIDGVGSTGSASNFSVGVTLDGGDNVDNDAQIAFEPPVDSVGQVRMLTNAYDASIGRSLGAKLEVTSKSGSRDFHGDVYYNNQNDFLNANTYSNDAHNKPITPVHLHYYGGAVGGPVWIPKFANSKLDPSYDGRKRGTFFFFSFSGIRNSSYQGSGYYSLPSAAERQGDFSSSYTVSNGVTYPINIYDPNTIAYTNGVYSRKQFGSGCTGTSTYPQPSTCNVIPSGRIDPIAKAVMALLPLPNSQPLLTAGNDTNNYYYQTAQINRFNSEMLRLDHAWNNANHTFVNLRHNYFTGTGTDPLNNSTYISQIMPGHRKNLGMTIDHTLLFSEQFLLDLNYNVMNYYAINQSLSSGMDATKLGFSQAYVDQMQVKAIPQLTGSTSSSGIDGLPILGTGTADQYNNELNQDLKASVVQMLGNHNFRYGVEYVIQQYSSGAQNNSAGTLNFGSNWTNETPVGTTPQGSGSSTASFMLGLPTGGSIPWVAKPMWSEHYSAVYFQDDWRVTPKFTLNLGLRYDYERPVTERFNKVDARFDPNYVQQGITNVAQPNYAAIVGQAAGSNAGLSLLQQCRSNASTFVAKGALLYAGVNGTPRPVLNAIKNDWQPRLGFAYQINKDMAVRGGLGRFIQSDFLTGAEDGYSQTTSMTATTNNYESAPTISMANPYPNGLQAITGNSQGVMTNVGSITSYRDPNLGHIYADIASVSLQQQVRNFLIDLTATLTKSRHLSMSWEVNDPTNAEWHAAYDPQFTSTGAPLLTQPGSTPVSNPFYHVAGVMSTLSTYTSSNTTAYQLLRPNPLYGNLTETEHSGASTYYALQAKVERRYSNGFSLLSSFTWGKSETANSFWATQVASTKIQKMLDSADTKFHLVVTPVYELPFGHGKRFAGHVNKLTDELIGGWVLDGTYTFQSGNPLSFPTNSNFFEGGDPSLGSKKSNTKWFDTSRFYQWPNSSTTKAQLATYPDWTGVKNLPGASWVPTPSAPGYANVNNGIYNDFSTRITYNQTTFGDVRNPFITDFTVGARKKMTFENNVHFEIGMDVFNALNHPEFGNINVTPGNTYFGYLGGGPASSWSQTNNPRTVQLIGKITF